MCYTLRTNSAVMNAVALAKKSGHPFNKALLHILEQPMSKRELNMIYGISVAASININIPNNIMRRIRKYAAKSEASVDDVINSCIMMRTM